MANEEDPSGQRKELVPRSVTPVGPTRRPTPAELVITRDEKHILQETITRYDVTPEASRMQISIAKHTHSIPARHQTYRAGLAVFGVGGLVWLATTVVPANALGSVFIAAIIALGGVLGAGPLLEKLKKGPPPGLG